MRDTKRYSSLQILIRTLALLMAAFSLAPVQPDVLAQNGKGSINAGPPDAPGFVYTMTNSATGNEIVVFNRASDGTLSSAGSFPTGGLGSGGGLGNQGALLLTQNGRWLFVVNAGSDEISVLEAAGSSLRLVDKMPSGGRRPISLTTDGRLLYVLNAGGSVGDQDNITGFIVSSSGILTPLPNSTRRLSAATTAPAQIQFSNGGNLLVVTEKSTNTITTYKLNFRGVPGQPIVQSSLGATPFGFAFNNRGFLLVSEAAGGAAGASSVSSYDLSGGGFLIPLSASVPTTQTAACWVVVTNSGRFAYASNTGSSTISSYSINPDGSIKLLQAIAANTDAGPIDMVLSHNSRFLYVLNSTAGAIGGYRIESDGRLTSLPGSVGGLPAGANGLAAR